MNNIDNVKVSVIIPLYNAQKYMDDSILSVRQQSHENLEIILVNDGSTDDTGLLCEEYGKLDQRVRVIHQDNAGPGTARNHGLDVATGEFVCFVDSDDKLASSAIERMLRSMDCKCDMIQCRSEKVYADGRRDEEQWKEQEIKITPIDAIKDYLHSTKPIVRFSVWAKLIRRSAIGDLRFPEMNNSEDVVFNAYLIDRCRWIQYIPEVLYFVTVREGSLSRTDLTREKIESSLKCNEMILKLIQSDEEYCFLLSRAYWSSVTTMISKACIVYQQKKENWKNDIAFLSEKCRMLKVPHALMSTKQWGMICVFRSFPILFVILCKKIIP